jgi:hypothetical protein
MAVSVGGSGHGTHIQNTPDTSLKTAPTEPSFGDSTISYTDQKNHLRSLRYGAAQIDRIFSGLRQTALQDSAAASRRAS